VPASHKQLLALFGVSPQAAVYVAVFTRQTVCEVANFPACSLWNPHLLAAAVQSGIDDPAGLRLQAATALAIEALQPQLQEWSDTPLLKLLQPVLLYQGRQRPVQLGQ
jgi:hypothetical protein